MYKVIERRLSMVHAGMHSCCACVQATLKSCLSSAVAQVCAVQHRDQARNRKRRPRLADCLWQRVCPLCTEQESVTSENPKQLAEPVGSYLAACIWCQLCCLGDLPDAASSTSIRAIRRMLSTRCQHVRHACLCSIGQADLLCVQVQVQQRCVEGTPHHHHPAFSLGGR